MFRACLIAALGLGASMVQAQTVTIGGTEIVYAHQTDNVDVEDVFANWRADERGRRNAGTLSLVYESARLSLRATQGLTTGSLDVSSHSTPHDARHERHR